MLWIIIGILTVLLAWVFVLFVTSHRKRLALTNYGLLILLEDEARDAQRKFFLEWLDRTSSSESPIQLAIDASSALEGSAAQISESMKGTLGLGQYLKKRRMIEQIKLDVST